MQHMVYIIVNIQCTHVCFWSDEEKVLEQLIKDTEEATVDDEVGVDLEEEGSGVGAESGASALLDEFIMR